MPKFTPLRLSVLTASTAVLLAGLVLAPAAEAAPKAKPKPKVQPEPAAPHAPAPTARVQEVTDAQIEKTIEEFKKAIYNSQDKASGRFPGQWDSAHGGVTGGTAMATLALLVSGESMQGDRIEKALKFLADHPTDQTYAIGVLAHVWSYLPFASYLPYQDQLESEIKKVLAGKSAKGMFWGDYTVKSPTKRDDLSVMQYCVLALWQGRKRNIRIDPYLWEGIADHMIKRQNPDGGWSYMPGQESTESMTCAGLTILYVCQQERDRTRAKADPKMTAALDKGQAFIEKNFTVDGHTNHHITQGGGARALEGYHMYGYERIALASGLRYIKQQDWFTGIAGRIVADGVGKAGSQENRAFKLMFMARGKSPVWCNKLVVPGAACRNRPNDVYFASHWLSEMTKGDLNWVAVDVNSTSDRWLNAPVAYLSVDEKVVLDEAQEKNLRNYVDHGGILVLNCENASSTAWAKEFAKKLYPKYPLGDPLPEGMLADGFSDGKIPGVQAIHNGARDMVLVVQGDHGMRWQADAEPDYKTPAWRFLFNLYRVASDRGKRVARLRSPFELPSGKRSGDQVKVVIPKYDGNCQPENRPYDIMDIYVGNRTGAKVVVDKETELAKVGDSDASFLHIMGTDAVTLKPEEAAAIKAFVDKGGTVLVETVGGHSGKSGLFALSARDAILSAFPGAETHRLADDSPLIKGFDFPSIQDNTAIDRVLWRQVTVERGQKDSKMRVEAITVKDAAGKDREAVLFSDEDLTLGMNRVRTYGINGYEQTTAQHFMLNLLAQSFKSKPSPK